MQGFCLRQSAANAKVEKAVAWASNHSFSLSWAFSLLGFFILLASDLDPDNAKVSRCAASAFLMATLWMLTPIPISATALLPLVLFPLLGVLDGRTVSSKYLNDTQFTFIGSFLVAAAIEEAQLHRRAALSMLRVLGVQPKWLLIGFCLVTFGISMCLSNTATAIMLTPLAQAVANKVTGQDAMLEQTGEPDTPRPQPADGDAADVSAVGRTSSSSRSFSRCESLGEGGGEGGEGGSILRPTPILKPIEVSSGEAGPSHISLDALPPPGEIVIEEEEGPSEGGQEEDCNASGQKEGREGNRRGAEERGEARLIEGDASAGGGEVKRVGWKWSGWDKGSCDDPDEAGTMLKKGLALAVAYSANIGGIATLTGTMPNLVYAGQLPTLFPSAEPTSFSLWFSYCFPISSLMLAANVALLFYMYCPPPARGSKGFHSGMLSAEVVDMGPMRGSERLVLYHVFALVAMWFLRKGLWWEKGWSDLFPEPSFITDGTAAMLVSSSLFLFPADPTWLRGGQGGGRRLLDATSISKLPWDVTVLMGGGFALAEASKESGLARWLAGGLAGMGGLPSLPIIMGAVTLTSFVTEVNSNLAACNMLLPICAELAIVLGINPKALMISVTIACSFAFMLPIATPPNAIAFSTRVISTRDMLRTGVFLNLFSCLILTLWTWFAFESVFGESPWLVPEWALAGD